jgi:hypothetical protein
VGQVYYPVIQKKVLPVLRKNVFPVLRKLLKKGDKKEEEDVLTHPGDDFNFSIEMRTSEVVKPGGMGSQLRRTFSLRQQPPPPQEDGGVVVNNPLLHRPGHSP